MPSKIDATQESLIMILLRIASEPHAARSRLTPHATRFTRHASRLKPQVPGAVSSPDTGSSPEK